MPKHVMVDLETFSLQHDALILSLGAVKFDPNQPRVNDIPMFDDAFYVCIEPTTCTPFKRHIDPGTVMWWMDEERAKARASLFASQKVDFATALEAFAMWFGPESLPVWGNGAGFDNEVLKSAFASVGLQVPWSYKDDRCYRTMKNLAPGIPLPEIGVAHQALDDASAQAAHLQDIVQHLGLQL